MKSIVKSKTANQEVNNREGFFVFCGCGTCSVLEVAKYDEDVYMLSYFAGNGKRTNKKSTWDMVLDSSQIQDIIDNLKELKEIKIQDLNDVFPEYN